MPSELPKGWIDPCELWKGLQSTKAYWSKSRTIWNWQSLQIKARDERCRLIQNGLYHQQICIHRHYILRKEIWDLKIGKLKSLLLKWDFCSKWREHWHLCQLIYWCIPNGVMVIAWLPKNSQKSRFNQSKRSAWIIFLYQYLATVQYAAVT